MKRNTLLALGLSAALMLTMAACSSQSGADDEKETTEMVDETTEVTEETTDAGETTDAEETGTDTLTIAASFQDASGQALASVSVLFAVDGVESECQTETDGTMTVTGLPRQGTIEVTVLDDEGAEAGTAVLEISEGSVTDVTEQEDGSYAVTLLTDAEQLSLTFAQLEDGGLSCALELSGETTA